jgi:hypothetical protein
MPQRAARLGRTMAGRAAELARAQEPVERARWAGVLARLGHARGQEEEGAGEWTQELAWAAFGVVGRVSTSWDGRVVEEEEQWVGAPLTGGPGGWAGVPCGG